MAGKKSVNIALYWNKTGAVIFSTLPYMPIPLAACVPLPGRIIPGGVCEGNSINHSGVIVGAVIVPPGVCWHYNDYSVKHRAQGNDRRGVYSPIQPGGSLRYTAETDYRRYVWRLSKCMITTSHKWPIK